MLKSKIVLCGYRYIVYRYIVYIKTDNIYKNIAEDVETRFDMNYIGHCIKEKTKNDLINER